MIAADRLTQDHVFAACDALEGAGVGCSPGPYEEPGSAADIVLLEHAAESGQGRAGIMAATESTIRAALPDVDVVVQPAQHRRKRLLVADMDSTMITVECIDELADYAGLKAEVAAITERAMRGELDFEAALAARVGLLGNMEAEVIDRCREERVRLMPGARTLVRTMKARGAKCILVSGGFTRFAEPVAAEIGFDRVVANELEIAGGRLTGRVRPPVVGAETKRQVLVGAATEQGFGLEQALAVGDGANDIPMLQAAGLGVAYHAKPAAVAAADAAIRHGDLTSLLYAQGIPRTEWVTD